MPAFTWVKTAAAADGSPDKLPVCDAMDADATNATRPTCYRIVLKGELGDDFRVLFEGLRLKRAGGETSLTGKLDQAQLCGVIARVQNLGIELVSIEPVAEASAAAG